MTKFARNRDGYLIDVYRVPEDFPTTERRDRCLGADGWIVVPDDIINGAKVNGDGTYTNPLPPQAPVIAPVLSKTAFMDVCEIAFGGGATGRARFGKIIKACETSTDDEVRFVYEKFKGAQWFEKAKVFAFITVLIGKGAALVDPPVSVAERAAVNSGWPNA